MENTELQLNLRRQLIIARARVAALKDDGLLYYNPYDKQTAFHEAGARVRKRMFRAGNRAGKSTCGGAETCAWLRRERPWYPKDSPMRTAGIPQRPVKGLLITTDWDVVKLVWTNDRGTKGKLWRFLPSSVVEATTRYQGTIREVYLKNGSMLRFETVKSFMNDPQSCESADWDFVHVDEPCPEEMFKAVARGLVDRGGHFWFTLTPLAEPWITDLFFPQDTGGLPRDDVFAIQAEMSDNPYLSEENIKEYSDLLKPEERDCRLLGIPLHLAGLVYKEFQPAVHVLQTLPEGWKNWVTPPKRYPIYYYIDPHPQTPHCVIFLTVDPLGRLYVLNDIFRHCTITQLCKDEMHPYVYGKRVIRGRIDPSASIADPITGTTMIEEFEKCGFYVEKAVKDLSRGILQVQEVLRNKMLFFTPAARRSLWEIQRYCWNPNGENKPVDKDDHAMECLYRAVLDDPKWVDVEPDKFDVPVDDEEFTGRDLYDGFTAPTRADLAEV